MKHYLITFRNIKIGDVKIVADNSKEARDNALTLARFTHKGTRVTIKDVWLCTKADC